MDHVLRLHKSYKLNECLLTNDSVSFRVTLQVLVLRADYTLLSDQMYRHTIVNACPDIVDL